MTEEDSVFETKARNFAENFFRSCDKQTNEPVKGKVSGTVVIWMVLVS